MADEKTLIEDEEYLEEETEQTDEETETNGKKYTDVRRLIEFKKGDIYICRLDEDNQNSAETKLFSSTGLIGKARPCMIYSNDEHNKTARNTYYIIPIKTNHSGKSAQEYIDESLDILVPIWFSGVQKFLNISQLRPISACRISSYLGTVINHTVLEKVDKLVWYNTAFRKDDLREVFKTYGSYDNILNFLLSQDTIQYYIQTTVPQLLTDIASENTTRGGKQYAHSTPRGKNKHRR
jgi:mRNA-degrading endonuclease toxin of MazEF toxin-antitoxin module